MQGLSNKRMWALALVLAGWSTAVPAQQSATIVMPIDPIDPIEPPMVLPESIARPVPPTYKPKPVQQRIEALGGSSFMVLPKDAPLPNGNISRDILAPAQTLQEPTVPAPALQAGKLKAEMVTLPDGDEVLQLRGLSKGQLRQPIMQEPVVAQVAEPQVEVPAAQPKPTVPAPKPPKPAKPKVPQPENREVRMSYFADQIQPEDTTPLVKLVAKAKGRKVLHLGVTMQQTPLPMEALAELPNRRWQWLNGQFKAAGLDLKGVPTSEIMLTHPTEQFVDVELVLAPAE